MKGEERKKAGKGKTVGGKDNEEKEGRKEGRFGIKRVIY